MARNKYDVDETLDEKYSAGNLKRALVYLKPYAGKMVLALLLSAAASLLILAGPTLVQKAIDDAIPNKDIPKLATYALMILGAVVTAAILLAIRGITMAKVGQSLVHNMRRDIFSRLQELPFSYYDNRPQGKILVRVVQYVNNVSDMLSNGMINVVANMLNVIMVLFYMYMIDWKLATIIVSGVPVLFIILLVFKPMQRRVRLIMNNKASNLTAYTCESIDGVKVTQIFDRQDINRGIYDNLSQAARKSWLNTIYVMNAFGSLSNIMSQLIVCLLYAAGILWFSPQVEVGVLIAMASYAGQFWNPIIALANLYNNFLNTLSYLERIFETIDEPVEICDSPEAKPIENMQGNVEFSHVTFAYEADKVILDDVSFTVKKGERIALVGPTGAGKSTIVSLISRFYDINDGDILIDGRPLRSITLQSLRSQMGIMLQDSFIFSGSIADNVRYGKLDATDEEIRAACEAVHADEFIQKMDSGYNTVVNERGGQLSQGEKQLLSFARTMLSDPAILVLDEATSSIDAKTERLLQQGIEVLLQGRTSFIIAHRLSTIHNCDKIMFIADGKIAECGTHDELMALKGRYYDLCTAQKI